MVDGSIPGSGDLESPELRRSHAGLAQSRAARPAPSETNEGPLVVEGEVPATWSASFGTRSALKMMGWDGIETLEVLDILWRVGGFDMI